MTISLDPWDDDYCSNTDATELYGLSSPASGYSWTVGPLGSYQYQVGPSLYQSVCTYNQSLNGSSDASAPSNLANQYIYYDSEGGNITKLIYFPNDAAREVVYDLPGLVTINDKAVECTTRTDSIESVWVATQNGAIQQRWTDTKANTISGSTNQTGVWNPGPQLPFPRAFISANVTSDRPNLHRQYLPLHLHPRPQPAHPDSRLLPSG
jgi:hypothetical protein